MGNKSYIPGQIFESYGIDGKDINLCLRKGFISLLQTNSPVSSVPLNTREYERDYNDF